jgi:hypothetical protein
MKTLLPLATLLLSLALTAAEGTTTPQVLDGLTFKGSIKPEGDPKAKGEPIILYCQDDTIESTWLSEHGVKEVTVEPGGFSDKHVAFHAVTVSQSTNRGEMDVTVDDLKKFKATLKIIDKENQTTTWTIEAKREKKK